MALPAFNVLSLFAGAGGLDLGIRLAVPSARAVCFVEREAYAAAVLAARMEDGGLDAAPIWSDVCAFDGRPWRGVVDCVAGGFPCQDISVAGRGAGIDGERSGLWREYARIVREVEPRYVFVENVAALVVRGLDVVLGDLAALGFAAEWCVFRASDAGAPHRRERLFILAARDVPDSDGRGVLERAERRVLRQAERGDAEPLDVGAAVVDAGCLVRVRGASGPQRGSGQKRGSELAGRETLADSARDGRREGRPESARKQVGLDATEPGVSLRNEERERAWQTPRVSSCHGWSEREVIEMNPKARLETQAELSCRGRQPQATPTDGETTSHAGRVLNPRFVEALMGWPIGWTDCDCSATESSPSKQPSPCEPLPSAAVGA